MSDTAELPYFYLDEIFELMGYKSLRSAYVAIDNHNFPVKTYKLARRIVADKAVVRAFFADERTKGADHLRKRTQENDT